MQRYRIALAAAVVACSPGIAEPSLDPHKARLTALYREGDWRYQEPTCRFVPLSWAAPGATSDFVCGELVIVFVAGTTVETATALASTVGGVRRWISETAAQVGVANRTKQTALLELLRKEAVVSASPNWELPIE